MIEVPNELYQKINTQIGNVVDGKIVVDNTNVVEIRNRITDIMNSVGCKTPIDLLFKIVPLGDSVVIQMKL